MSIGSTVVDSIPTVGTTVHTLAKLSPGRFAVDVESGTVDIPVRLTLRASPTSGLSRRLGATMQFDPSVLDVSDALTEGRVSVTMNVDAKLGETITRSELLNYIRYFFGALSQANLLEALVDGSLE
jgi:hypothetical protein